MTKVKSTKTLLIQNISYMRGKFATRKGETAKEEFNSFAVTFSHYIFKSLFIFSPKISIFSSSLISAKATLPSVKLAS
mgnify:FL=1